MSATRFYDTRVMVTQQCFLACAHIFFVALVIIIRLKNNNFRWKYCNKLPLASTMKYWKNCCNDIWQIKLNNTMKFLHAIQRFCDGITTLGHRDLCADLTTSLRDSFTCTRTVGLGGFVIGISIFFPQSPDPPLLVVYQFHTFSEFLRSPWPSVVFKS